MGRCNGYRPKKAVRDEVTELRARLADCRSDQWQRAGVIMDKITALLGHSGGPMRGKINPRSCRVCHRFGHTRQFCPVLREREEAELDMILQQDAAHFAEVNAREVRKEVYDPRTGPQAQVFLRLGIPFEITELGPMPYPEHASETF